MAWIKAGYPGRQFYRVSALRRGALPCLVAVIAVLAPLASVAQAPEKPRIDWKTKYAEAIALAKEQEKPVLIDFFAAWCGPCHMMDEQTFTDPAVVKASTEFVCIKIDVDADEKTAFAYGIGSIPRTIVLNIYGEIVGDRIGFMAGRSYTGFLNDVREYTHQKVDGIVIGVPAEVPETITIEPDAKIDEIMKVLASPSKGVREKAREVVLAMEPDQVKRWMRQGLASPYLGERIAAKETLSKLDPSAWPDFDPWATVEERAKSLAQGD